MKFSDLIESQADFSSSEDVRQTILQYLSRTFRFKINNYLDIGCGDGEFTLKIAELLGAKNVYGIDLSERALRVAKTIGLKKVYRIDINWEKLPFISNKFEFVSCIEVLEHLINPDFMLSEVYRVLKKGGFFLISTPNLASWINRFLILAGYMPHMSEPSLKYRAGMLAKNKIMNKPSLHLRLYTLKALKELLAFYGFKLIDHWGSPFSYSVLSSIINPLDKLISKFTFLASYIIIIVKK